MQRILAICPSSFDRVAMAAARYRGRYELISHGSYDPSHPEEVEPVTFIEDAVRQFRGAAIDGVVGTHDYPGSILAAAIARGLGLPGPDPEAMLRTQHKVYCRQVCARAVPEVTPRFRPIPATLEEADIGDLAYPFFIKPVKAMMSVLAETVADAEALSDYLRRAQSHAESYMRPFDELLRRYPLAGVADASGFVGEELLTGEQVTVEGFIAGGEATIIGVVDSIMYPGTISFERFEYPSRLPAGVQQRMAAATVAAVEALGLDDCQFNVELFYDAAADTLGIIEINPRMSYQFSDMFAMVDGTASWDVLLEIATGGQPIFERGGGPFGVAVSFVGRTFEDKAIRSLPSEETVAAVLADFPDAQIQIFAKAGQRLSELSQDAESFRYSIINVGGADRADAGRRHRAIRERLAIAFDDVPDDFG